MNPTKIWNTYTAAPHRMFFATGCLLVVLPMAWWTYFLYVRVFGDPQSLIGPPAQAHAVVMLYGALSQFVLGFALTVFPRWLNTADYNPQHLKQLLVIFCFGWILYLIGLWQGEALMLVGIFANLTGFVVFAAMTLKVLLVSNHPDPFQVRFTWLAIASSPLGVFFYLLYLIFEDLVLYRLSIGIGLFFYLPLLVFSIGYRMVPFFTKNVVKGYRFKKLPWTLFGVTLFCAVKALSFAFSEQRFYLIADGGLLVCLVAQFYNWSFFGPKKVWLLRYLYYALAWLPIACVLFILVSIDALLKGYPNLILESSAIHALAVGCVSLLVFGMVTRVSLGHSGRPLQSGLFEDFLFLVLLAAAVTRVGIEWLRLLDPVWESYFFIPGILWLTAFLPWSIKYLPIYFRPRIDGKPG